MTGAPTRLTDEQLAVWLGTQVSIAASGMDGPNVLPLVKELATALAEGKVELRAVPKPALVDGEPFKGRPMPAKFGGTCVVCSKPITAGTTIVYNAEVKRAAHLGCGQPDTSRRARP